MAGINFHPAPGNTHKLPAGFVNFRGVSGVGDIVATDGFSVPDRDMVAATMTMGIGDILATQGFSVPNRDMNPVADYVSGNVKPLGQSKGVGGCGCSSCSAPSSASLNGVSGVGDIAADFSAIQGDFTAGNYSAILSAPIMGIPYALPLLIGAAVVLPMMLGGSGGRRRR